MIGMEFLVVIVSINVRQIVDHQECLLFHDLADTHHQTRLNQNEPIVQPIHVSERDVIVIGPANR